MAVFRHQLQFLCDFSSDQLHDCQRSQCRASAAFTFGINSAITNLPASFTHRTILVVQNGINHGFNTWGNALTGLSGKMRPANDAAVELNKLDIGLIIGAAYYYNYVSNLGYAGTLLSVANEFASNSLPLGYMQLDSWWYPKGASDIWTATGSAPT